MTPPPPPDPDNPRDLRNTHGYRRVKERNRLAREQQQLTITEPLPPPMKDGDDDGEHGVDITLHDTDTDTDTDTGTGTDSDAPDDGLYCDDDNAREFISTCHEDVRYCVYLDEWRQWHGLRWERDTGGCRMVQRVRRFSRSLRHLAQQLTYGPDVDAMRSRGLALGNVNRATALLKFARADERITVHDPAVWDADPLLLGVENGVVDLRTLRFHPPERSIMMTKAARVSYDPAATCPKWEAFLEQILPDAEVRHFMQVSAGYWLTGDTSAQCFWFCYGAGANGKSTFLNTLYRLSGDYAQKAGDMLAVNAKGNNVPLELSTLPGVRFLTGNEVTDGMKLHESLVKDITGGDVLKGREHYEAFFNFRPACKLIMYGNHRPTITGTDGGMWRRVRLVPFTQVIPPDQRNPHLEKEFIAELPGILNWCLRGLAWWLEHGKLPMPKAVMQATEGYREDSDPLGEFLAEHTEKVLDPDEKTLLNDLFKQYSAWCEESGRKHPMSRQTLRMRMEERGYASMVIRSGRCFPRLVLRKGDEPMPF